MVKIQQPSEYDRLDEIVRQVADRHQLRVHVAGWARKTYDVFAEDHKSGKSRVLARVESFATTSGEIRIYEERALSFAQELGEQIEQAFPPTEAVIIRERSSP